MYVLNFYRNLFLVERWKNVFVSIEISLAVV